MTAAGWDPSQMVAGIKKWAGQVEDAASDAVREQAEEWLEEGNKRAPRDTDALVNSGRVMVDGTTAGVGWGEGLDRDYVVIQHENTSYEHPGGGGAKFAELAGRKVAQTAGAKIADRIKSRTGG